MSAFRVHVGDVVTVAVAKTFRVVDSTSIDRETSAADIDGWDSLSHTMLLMEIEQGLGFELPLDTVYGAKNIGELIDVICSIREEATE
jgi:acyl carrier protein